MAQYKNMTKENGKALQVRTRFGTLTVGSSRDFGLDKKLSSDTVVTALEKISASGG